jgi:hypothetical protein
MAHQRIYESEIYVVFREGDSAVLVRNCKHPVEVLLRGQDAADFLDQMMHSWFPDDVCKSVEPRMTDLEG